MMGLMQDWPLLIHKVIDHAAREHGARKVISPLRRGADPSRPTTRDGPRPRALQVAQRLARDGIGLGDRVATLAWNTCAAPRDLVRHHRHRRGLPHGQPAPVRGADRLHHEPRRGPASCSSTSPSCRWWRSSPPRLPSVERYVVLTDAAHMPETQPAQRRGLRGLARPRPTAISPGRSSTRTPRRACATPPARRAIPRACSTRTAPTCCTRCMLSRRTCSAWLDATTCMPVVPLFHANGWSLAFSAPMAGAKLVMPGAKLDGASVTSCWRPRR